MEREQWRNTFILTHPLISLTIIVAGFILLPLFAFYPWAFGQTAGDALNDYSFVFQGLFYFEVAAHSLEALVGIFLLVKIKSTLSNAIKWTSSILLNGGFSLIYLVRIYNQMQSAQKLRESD